MKNFDRLIATAEKQARRAGLKRSHLTEAIRKIREKDKKPKANPQ